MDSTNKHSMYMYGQLKESETNFQLNGSRLNQWLEMKKLNNFIRKEHHNIHRLIWKPYVLSDATIVDQTPELLHYSLMPFKQNIKNNLYDSCRLSGSLIVNKVSGNFHIAAGKYLPLPIGHAHISLIEYEKCNLF